MNSYNHYAFGAVGEWIYRDAAGIDTAGSGAGFRHFVLSPHPDARLHSLRATYDSHWGTIVSAWQTTPSGEVTLHIVVPANTSAIVRVPGTSRSHVHAPAGARFVRTQTDAVVYEVPAGSYIFRGRVAGQ
jgi:alpha-L-rhamnosidase